MSSAYLPAVAGTHAPGRGEGVVGSRIWFEYIITVGSSCRGCKGPMPSGGKVDATHALGGGGGLDSICKL